MYQTTQEEHWGIWSKTLCRDKSLWKCSYFVTVLQQTHLCSYSTISVRAMLPQAWCKVNPVGGFCTENEPYFMHSVFAFSCKRKSRRRSIDGMCTGRKQLPTQLRSTPVPRPVLWVCCGSAGQPGTCKCLTYCKQSKFISKAKRPSKELSIHMCGNRLCLRFRSHSLMSALVKSL